MRPSILLVIPALALSFSCKDDEQPIDPVTLSLVDALNPELISLSQDPGQWTDSQLTFLDAFGERTIVGLGEATHGTSEFFKAKHRMFRYLAEHHGFKIFAIEADVGESMLINEAVLAGDKSKIVDLMKSKMQFWTWKTTEVRDMLFWMCDYNAGKMEEDKVQYWGIDCQYNLFNADLARDQLVAANVSFLSFAEPLLYEAKTATANSFSAYSAQAFGIYLEKLDMLTDSVISHKADIVSATSNKQYELTLHLVDMVKQVSDVRYHPTINYRDQYMAGNAKWLSEYFDGSRMVLWAHNAHISNNSTAFTMGYFLGLEIPDYSPLGFLFSKGSFMAVTQSGNDFKGLEMQSLDSDPKAGSMMDVMSRAESPVFTVNIPKLQSHSEWNSVFTKGMEYFEVGSVYDNQPEDYYTTFNPAFFRQVIYFNTTTAATQLQ